MATKFGYLSAFSGYPIVKKRTMTTTKTMTPTLVELQCATEKSHADKKSILVSWAVRSYLPTYQVRTKFGKIDESSDSYKHKTSNLWLKASLSYLIAEIGDNKDVNADPQQA